MQRGAAAMSGTPSVFFGGNMDMYGCYGKVRLHIKQRMMLVLCGAWLVACRTGRRLPEEQVPAELKLVVWNVQTFFDAVTDGTEFSSFSKSRGLWNRERYAERVERLCAVLKQLDADVAVLLEVEHKGIIYDISNGLASESWKRAKRYRYAFFARAPDASFGCAVLSRYNLADACVHMVQTDTAGAGRLRPILQTDVVVQDRRLTLFVNHWKSKSGGEAATAPLRRLQEQLLAACIQPVLRTDTGYSAVVACGDFNRDEAEFEHRITGTGHSVVMKAADGSEVLMHSPWTAYDKTLPVQGSYYYRNRWERIDCIFSCGACSIKGFRAEYEGPWAQKNGTPYAYRLSNGQGYSDHLPVSCRIQI